MPKYIIERDLPGAGKLTKEELQGISEKSCGVLKHLGPQIQWLESYVTPDKIYCVYIAPSEDLIRRHAAAGGFPANRISEVKKDRNAYSSASSKLNENRARVPSPVSRVHAGGWRLSGSSGCQPAQRHYSADRR